jgi:hypothetical protein
VVLSKTIGNVVVCGLELIPQLLNVAGVVRVLAPANEIAVCELAKLVENPVSTALSMYPGLSMLSALPYELAEKSDDCIKKIRPDVTFTQSQDVLVFEPVVTETLSNDNSASIPVGDVVPFIRIVGFPVASRLVMRVSLSNTRQPLVVILIAGEPLCPIMVI